MELYKPSYYDDFKCIAGECDFTCCRDWTISVDEDTKMLWEKLEMDGKKLSLNVHRSFSCDAIKLLGDHRCPYINKDGLCSIVLKYGDEAIPDTCREFPREAHYFESRCEKNLTPGCEETLRILLSQEKFLVKKETVPEESEIIKNVCSDILFEIRDRMLEIMGDTSEEPEILLNTIMYLLSILYQYESEEWAYDEKSSSYTENFVKKAKELINTPDLQKIKDVFRAHEADKTERFIERNELLLDGMENYIKKGMYAEYLEDIESLALRHEEEDYIADYEKTVKIGEFDFNKMMRLILCEEIFSSLLTPGINSIEGMLVKFQWLALEYAVISHAAYLYWEKDGQVSFEKLMRLTAVFFRIFGYSDEDVFEYMENNFEDIIWPMGYFSLLI